MILSCTHELSLAAAHAFDEGRMIRGGILEACAHQYSCRFQRCYMLINSANHSKRLESSPTCNTMLMQILHALVSHLNVTCSPGLLSVSTTVVRTNTSIN
jgi:hypothetical protein